MAADMKAVEAKESARERLTRVVDEVAGMATAVLGRLQTVGDTLLGASPPVCQEGAGPIEEGGVIEHWTLKGRAAAADLREMTGILTSLEQALDIGTEKGH